MAEEFILPDFLADRDVDTIHEEMLNRLPADIDRMEGGFLWDFTRPTAIIASELLQFYAPEILKLMFGQWSTGKYLDWLAEIAQVQRKAATYATVYLSITGNPGTVIPSGTVFCTETDADVPSIEFATDEPVSIGEEGTVGVMATAVEAGASSNVYSNTIIMMSEPLNGVDTVTNAQPAAGGTDEESDEDLRERFLYATRNSDAYFIGNMADYKRWAESIPGMGTALVMFNWDGPETIKIVCIDANGDAASQTILDAVYDYIMSPNDPLQRLAPPNAILTVAAPEFIPITYDFKVVLEDGYVLETVVESFKQAVYKYYRGVSKAGAVRYTIIGMLLSETTGVVDYKDLTVNDGTVNIEVRQDQYPQTFAVNATEIGEV
jgi:uncharacterized phage protein gp47/JayE